MEEAAPVAHPTLYGQLADGALAIFGQRCGACGAVSFPRQPYGCETCGAHGEALAAANLAAEGELVSFAQVHRHHGRDIQAPFVMAEVRLSGGPLIRATLGQRDEAGLRIGAAMTGVLVMGEAASGQALELRFQPKGA